MTATIPTQDTAALAVPTGPLTVPLEIIRAAGARHRVAVAAGDAVPGWAILAATTVACALIAFAVVVWRDVASPLLILCALGGIIAAITPDVLAALPQHDEQLENDLV